MIKWDNSEAIRRHELEDRQRRCKIFIPPESLSQFSDMSYRERVYCAEHYPDLYNHFVRMEREKK